MIFLVQFLDQQPEHILHLFNTSQKPKWTHHQQQCDEQPQQKVNKCSSQNENEKDENVENVYFSLRFLICLALDIETRFSPPISLHNF